MTDADYRPVTYSVLGTAAHRSPLLLLSDDPQAFGVSGQSTWAVLRLRVDDRELGGVIAEEVGYGDFPEDALFHAAVGLTRQRAACGATSAEAVLLLEASEVLSAADLGAVSREAGLNGLRRLLDSLSATGVPPDEIISALMDEYVGAPAIEQGPRRDV